MGKVLPARQTISYLLSFQAHLSILEAVSSSSTTQSQESLEPDARLVSGNGAAFSSSSDSVVERSDELATRKLGQESVSDAKQDAKDPLADMPFWVQHFTDNLKVPEMPAPAHSYHDSDSEHLSKVVSTSRKHSVFTHFREGPKLGRMLEDQNYKSLLQKTHWRSSTSCRKVW